MAAQTLYQTQRPCVKDELPREVEAMRDYILLLCQNYGYCFAKNRHFAEKYEVSERQISRRFTMIEEAGYIYTYRVGNERRCRPGVMPVTPRCLPEVQPNRVSKKESLKTKQTNTPSAAPAPAEASVVGGYTADRKGQVKHGRGRETGSSAQSERVKRGNEISGGSAGESQEGNDGTPYDNGIQTAGKLKGQNIYDTARDRRGEAQAVDTLTAEGVSVAVASKLSQETTPERLAATLRAYREARRTGKARGEGWLVTAIQEKWNLSEPEVRKQEAGRLKVATLEELEADRLRPDWQTQRVEASCLRQRVQQMRQGAAACHG